ncbi:MAG: type II toxin-antitoxin system VapC family toxin [Steroidobacteraceae bacterium]
MLVVDSSAVLAWALADEQDHAEHLLDRMSVERAVVPAHWILEVTNGLRMAVRRRRLKVGEPAEIVERLRILPITIDLETTVKGWSEIPALAEKFALTTYDAAYLELAMRLDAPLATLDRELSRAARSAKVKLQT